MATRQMRRDAASPCVRGRVTIRGVEAVLWIVLAIALAIAEAFTATFLVIFFAVGALAAAGAAALGAPLLVQAIVFAIVSGALGRRGPPDHHAAPAVRGRVRRHRRSASRPSRARRRWCSRRSTPTTA